ncbi:MAG: hypothetical protein ACUVQ0_04070 [Thermoproteota archaeon]
MRSMGRFNPHMLDGKGVSQAIQSVILILAAMSTSLAAFFYAQLNLTMQSMQTEFENAKESMVSLAKMIEDLSLTGGAAHVTLSAISGGIWLPNEASDETISIRVVDDMDNEFFTNVSRIYRIRFRGGEGVSSPEFKVLNGVSDANRPDEYIGRHLVVGSHEPLGWVYVKREGTAWIVMDFGRVRITPSGRIRIYNNETERWMDRYVTEITYINITLGEVGGSNPYDFYARVRRTCLYSFNTTSSYATITVERTSGSQTYPPVTYVVQFSDPTAYSPSLIFFFKYVEVEISVR